MYRFKVALVYHSNLWREIEVQGEYTLADLDQTLREAFNHDSKARTQKSPGWVWMKYPREVARNQPDLLNNLAASLSLLGKL